MREIKFRGISKETSDWKRPQRSWWKKDMEFLRYAVMNCFTN
jgi:hypothetical protein